MKIKNIYKEAFSLVEISIVILIVGILITGISKGLDLYQDAKLIRARTLTDDSIVNSLDGLTIWLETTSTKSFNKENPRDNELISQWKDINPQRTLKINFVQTNASKQPKYIKNGINGFPVLEFSTNLTMNSATSVTTNDFTSYDKATFFIVGNQNDGAGNSLNWSSSTRFNIIIRDYVNYSPANQFWFGPCCPSTSRMYLGSTTETVKSKYKNKIYSFVKNGSNGSMRMNYNLLKSSSSTFSGVASKSSIGPLNIGNKSNGQFAEIIIFNRALSEAERYSVENYLSQKWGIVLIN